MAKRINDEVLQRVTEIYNSPENKQERKELLLALIIISAAMGLIGYLFDYIWGFVVLHYFIIPSFILSLGLVGSFFARKHKGSPSAIMAFSSIFVIISFAPPYIAETRLSEIKEKDPQHIAVRLFDEATKAHSVLLASNATEYIQEASVKEKAMLVIIGKVLSDSKIEDRSKQGFISRKEYMDTLKEINQSGKRHSNEIAFILNQQNG